MKKWWQSLQGQDQVFIIAVLALLLAPLTLVWAVVYLIAAGAR